MHPVKEKTLPPFPMDIFFISTLKTTFQSIGVLIKISKLSSVLFRLGSIICFLKSYDHSLTYYFALALKIYSYEDKSHYILIIFYHRKIKKNETRIETTQKIDTTIRKK